MTESIGVLFGTEDGVANSMGQAGLKHVETMVTALQGEECFSFGKHKGKTVDSILENEPGYFGWLLNADFPMYTKKVLTAIRLRKLNTE